MISFRSFIVLSLKLMLVISSQLTFVCGVRWGIPLFYFACGCPIFWIPFVKETVLFLLHILGLSWINWTYMHWFYFWTFCYVLVTYMFVLWQYHGILIPSALFFFLNIVWAILDILWFHSNFRITFYICKICHWHFDRDCIESICCFWLEFYLNNINYSDSWIWNIFSCVYAFFQFLIAFQCKILDLLEQIHS